MTAALSVSLSLSLWPAENTVDCGDGQAAHGFKKMFKRWTAFEIEIIVSLALNHGELHFGDETSFQSHIVLFSEKKNLMGVLVNFFFPVFIFVDLFCILSHFVHLEGL